MKGANRQIGWSQEAILLQSISMKLAKIYGLAGSSGGGGITPLETDVSNSTAWNNGPGNIDTNTVFGELAFLSNVSGSENSIYGYNPFSNSTDGTLNTFVGVYTGDLHLGGIQNTGVGGYVMSEATTGSYNTGIGVSTMASENITGSYNTAAGGFILGRLQAGTGNTAAGLLALSSRTTTNFSGNYNIGLGFQSFRALSSGSNNIGILIELQDGVLTGSNNINIDSRNKPMANSANSNNVVIGGLDGTLTAADGQVVIGIGTTAAAGRRITFNTTGEFIITTAPTIGTGGYTEKAVLLDAVSDANGMSSIKTIDYAAENATTALLTKADLDTAYPSASIGFRVTCRAITATPKIYTKVSTTAWCSESIVNVA